VAEELRRIVSCEVHGEKWILAAYATDASPYEILPSCVALPMSAEDVSKIVRYAREKKIPVTARGGGSGLVGSALGRGIILDFTKYMNKVISIDDHYAVCEPGIFRDNLDSEINRRNGLTMPADPSSSPYCAVGGMIGTNASGAHSLKYGHTIDYLESVELVASDGSIIELGPVGLDSQEWKEIRAEGSSSTRSRIYNQLYDLLAPNVDLIKGSMPRVSKNSAGYRLDMVFDEKNNSFNPAKVLCGAEGTLGIVIKAKFRLIKKPKKKGLLLLRYDSFKEMGDAIPSLTKLGPSAVELMDKRVIEAASVLNPDVKSLNKGKLIAIIVEFDADSSDEVSRKLHELQREVSKRNGNESEIITDDSEIDKIWKMRELSLGFAYKIHEGPRRTECVIEDTVVPPEKLGEYLEKLEATYKEFGLDSMSWGHVSEGNIHTRPFLDYKSADDLAKSKKIADRIYKLAASYNGSSTGEHSDGILRAPYLKLIYNQRMLELFQGAKRIFDPDGIMNPGKKTDSLDESPLRDLRYGEDYKRKRDVLTPYASTSGYALTWAGDSSAVTFRITGRKKELSFEDEAEACFGCGRCREQSDTARMCPVYDADHDEMSACRGRNNLLRWMNKLEGLASSFATTKEYGRTIYENCVQCKMCLVDCPANTNVGKLMAEARARYVRARGIPRGYKFFFQIDKYANLGCKLAPISNFMMGSSFIRAITERVAGIDRRKSFPPFHRKRFIDRFSETHPNQKRSSGSGEVDLAAAAVASSSSSSSSSEDSGLRSVVFFYDTYLNYNNPELGMRIVSMLEKNGLDVIVPRQSSSGMPNILEGDPDGARKIAEKNVGSLAPFAERGIPIVTFSPSAGLTLKSDYLDVYDTPKSRLVSEQTFDIHEYLAMLNRRKLLRRDLMQPVELRCLVHLHCHTIVAQVGEHVKEVLHYIPKLDFDMLEDGCCGNGGSYSFIAGNYERSQRMGRALCRDISDSKLPVFSTGESCKIQLEQGAGKSVGLTSELLCRSFGV